MFLEVAMSPRNLLLLSLRQKRRILKNNINLESYLNNKSSLQQQPVITNDVRSKEQHESTPHNHKLQLESVSEIISTADSDLLNYVPAQNNYLEKFDIGEFSPLIDESNSSDSDCIDLLEDSIDLRIKLQKWGTGHNVTHSAISDLLKILKTHQCFSDLPSEARTLLQTPTTTVIRQVEPGQYCHLGLAAGIIKVLNKSNSCPETVVVHINIDGIPIHKSTNKQLWPILGSVKNVSDVFVIGIYEGCSKPNDLNNYLRDFVEESLELISNGIIYNSHKINFQIEAFICDAPARAFITSIKNHTGYYGCGKCIVKGKYIDNRVVMLKTDAELRTNDTFRGRVQEKHHNGISDLEKLPLDMVESFPYEYMHLICLGVTKKLVKLWTSGKVKVFRLGPKVILKISKKLVKVGKCLPVEFNRKQRPLSEIDRWKATELRTFLLYTGPLALKKHLPEQHYQLFLCLNFAIRILASPKQKEQLITYADSLLHYFVSQFKILYGKVNISYNIHGLIHLATDVRRLGGLDTFSAFKYENKLDEIKRLIRKSSGSLAQVHRRLIEKDSVVQGPFVNKVEVPVLSKIQSDGSYSAVKYKNFTLKPNVHNGTFCFANRQFAVAQKFLEKTGEVTVVCRKLCGFESAFTYPCDSSLISTINVDLSKLSSEIQIPISEINYKCVVLNESNLKTVVFPFYIVVK